MELTALKTVVKCISNFKLESIYSPASLESRIKWLEKDRKERKNNAHTFTIDKCSNIEKTGVKEMTAEISNSPDLPSDPQSDKKRPVNLAPPNEGKRPRVGVHYPHIPSLSFEQPSHVYSYGYPVRPHQQPSPAMSLSGYHYGASGAMYGFPFYTNSGDYEVAGIYPVGAPTYSADCKPIISVKACFHSCFIV